MDVLEDIVLEWAGKTYRVKNDMRAVRQVERVITKPEVSADLAANGTLCPVDISEIFCNLLNLGGAGVTHESVRAGMFGDVSGTEAKIVAMAIINSIMESRLPPDAGSASDANPPKPAMKRPSSRKRSNSRSASGK